jgi:hypothetical protein
MKGIGFGYDQGNKNYLGDPLGQMPS